jgi:hypothetical protein
MKYVVGWKLYFESLSGKSSPLLRIAIMRLSKLYGNHVNKCLNNTFWYFCGYASEVILPILDPDVVGEAIPAKLQYALKTPSAPVTCANAVVPQDCCTAVCIAAETAAELLSLKQAQLTSAVGGAGHDATVRLSTTPTWPEEAHCPTEEIAWMLFIYSVRVALGPGKVVWDPPAQ